MMFPLKPLTVLTDIQQKGAIFLLVDNVLVDNLVIQGLGLLVGGGHDEERGRED